MGSRLFVPHSQPASQPASPPIQNGALCLKSWSNPLGLVHKTLESDFRKNDTISMHSPSSNAINPLYIKLVRSRWLDIKLILFCAFMDQDFIPIRKNAKKNSANIQPSWLNKLGQYTYHILVPLYWNIIWKGSPEVNLSVLIGIYLIRIFPYLTSLSRTWE